MRTFAEVLGTNVRSAREATGLTQSELASTLRTFGLDVERTMITRIETGERGVRVQELALIAYALGQPIQRFIESDDDYLLTDTAVAHPDGTFESADRVLDREQMADALRAVLGIVGPAGLSPDLIARAGVERYDDANLHAAEVIGLTDFQTAALARHLWGRSLTEERNSRVEAQAGGRLGSLGVRRGHVTRALQQEMLRALRATGPASTDPPPPASGA